MYNNHKNLMHKVENTKSTTWRRFCMASSKHQESGMPRIFLTNGFMRNKSDPTLYYKQKGNGILIVSLYVDDLSNMGSSSKMKYEFKISMMNEFEIKHFGLMQYFLGMEVHQSETEIFICQTKYAKNMLRN